VMKTDCAPKDIEGYAFGLVCVDKVGAPVRHLFGKDSFDPVETFDTLITCNQCLGLEDIPDDVAMNGQVLGLMQEVHSLEGMMVNLTQEVKLLNEKIVADQKAKAKQESPPPPAGVAPPAPKAGALLQRGKSGGQLRKQPLVLAQGQVRQQHMMKALHSEAQVRMSVAASPPQQPKPPRKASRRGRAKQLLQHSSARHHLKRDDDDVSDDEDDEDESQAQSVEDIAKFVNQAAVVAKVVDSEAAAVSAVGSGGQTQQQSSPDVSSPQDGDDIADATAKAAAEVALKQAEAVVGDATDDAPDSEANTEAQEEDEANSAPAKEVPAQPGVPAAQAQPIPAAQVVAAAADDVVSAVADAQAEDSTSQTAASMEGDGFDD